MADTAVLTAFAILGGSALGGALSLASSWLSQHFQVRADRTARRTAALEALYGEFIDEASKVYADALTSNAAETSKLVGLYAKVSRMRFVSSPKVIASAEEVVRKIMDTYGAPNRTIQEMRDETDYRSLDRLRSFADVCRAELRDLRFDAERMPPPQRDVSGGAS